MKKEPDLNKIKALINSFSLKRYQETEQLARGFTKHYPKNAFGWKVLGLALYGQNILSGALAALHKARALQANDFEISNAIGAVLRGLGRVDEAVASYRLALKLKPDFAEAYKNLGDALLELGKVEEALTSYQSALKLKPDETAISYNICLCKKLTPDDKHFAGLVDYWHSIKNGRTLPAEQKLIYLHFALGKCYDDTGDYENAFFHFQDGCRLKRATFHYNPTAVSADFDRIIGLYDRESMDRLRGEGNPSRLPVFVLGFPRSGTTLVEQIIAGHPRVHGAGEITLLSDIIAGDVAKGLYAYPDCMLPETTHQRTAWSRAYITELTRLAPAAGHITNKTPGNFISVGLINLLFPNAKIIHLQRNPQDTMLSCFMTLFSGNDQKYSYDLTELKQYYADYLHMMAHWRNILPDHAFLDVSYEALVENPVGQARRIIEFCNLDWSESCLSFFNNKNPVKTASNVQVRQPVYKSSVDRWRRYEKFFAG